MQIIGRYASAFHYFSSAINLKPDFASSYMYLAITLNKLNDFDSACSAYEKAIEMEAYICRLKYNRDHTFYLNYAITLFNNRSEDKAREKFLEAEKIFAELDEETKNAEPEVLEQRLMLAEELKVKLK